MRETRVRKVLRQPIQRRLIGRLPAEGDLLQRQGALRGREQEGSPEGWRPADVSRAEQFSDGEEPARRAVEGLQNGGARAQGCQDDLKSRKRGRLIGEQPSLLWCILSLLLCECGRGGS